MNESLYWTSWTVDRIGGKPLLLMAGDRGLCRITWPDEGFEALTAWRDQHMPGTELREDDGRLQPYKRQLEEYLAGRRQAFTVSLDLRGTPFQVDVWKSLLQVPFGRTTSYSELAVAVGRPRAVRAVGAANGSNPVPFIVPCHRVIGKYGSLTGFRGGLPVKAELLRMEGAAL